MSGFNDIPSCFLLHDGFDDHDEVGDVGDLMIE